MLEIAVRRLDPRLPAPTYAHPGDAGADLHAAEDATLAPGERVLVPTGIAVALPDGYAAFVHPRSGLALRHGLSVVNTPGTIDAGYRGEIKVLLVNHDLHETVRIARGDRIAQLVVQRVEHVTFREVESLEDTSRGAGGYGSTGGHRIHGGGRMIRRRRERDDQAAQTDGAGTESDVAPATPTEEPSGPWDARDFTGDDTGYVDLGPLRIRGRVGFQLQVPQDDGGSTGSVVLVTEDSGLELRVFAAPRSGGLWDDVRGELLAEVERLEGTAEQVDGPFGPELRVQVPVKLPDGQDGFQPSRILAVEGPRWMLRATFLGSAALEPDEDGLLERAFREVVVVRGDEPRLVREALLIEVPEGAVAEEPPGHGTPA